MAMKYLDESDWYLIGFYKMVSDQYIHQTPGGVAKGRPSIITPRIEAYESALRIGEYPRPFWGWLTRGAMMVHNLVHKLDTIHWTAEYGKPLALVTPPELIDG